MTRVARRRRGRGGKDGHEPPQRLQRREQEAVRLATEGMGQHDIARALGISQPAVSQLLRRVDERWLRENHDRVARQKAEQTRKLNHLYGEAMRSWEQSKAQRTRRRQRKTNAAGTGETDAVAEIIVDDSHGDARYLEAARRILADLSRLWGTANAQGEGDAETDAPAIITLEIGDERIAPQFTSIAGSLKNQGECP